MAARLRKNHQDDVREKIQASQIVNRLMGHFEGNVELTPTQLKAGEILLRKSLPDLTSTTLENPDGSSVFSGIERAIIDSQK